MSEIMQKITNNILNGNVDLLDIVPIPKHGDKMVRLRTLEEALEDFDRNQTGEEIMTYMIQVRPSKNSSSSPAIQELDNFENGPMASPTPHSPKPSVDGTYHPDGKLNTPFLLKNAELLLTAGDTTLSKNVFKAILKSGDNTASALSGLARCYEAEGKLKEAQAHYEESIAYHATLESYQQLANLHLRLNQDKLAAEVLGRALHLKELQLKQRFELHKKLGQTLLQTSDNGKALSHFSKALELNPTADDIRTAIGHILQKHGNTTEAAKYFHDAVATNPRNEQALCGLGGCALAVGDKKSAHDYYAKALGINLNNPTAIFHLVKCAYEIKSYAVAARALEEYMEVAPINPNLLYSLAGLQFHLSRFDNARATLARLTQISPNHTGAKELATLIARYIGPAY